MKNRLEPAGHPVDADDLAPLLDSIAREVAERRARLERLESRIAALRESPFYAPELGLLQADAAADRRELHRCHAELERLGCAVVGTAPLTFRVPASAGSAKKTRTWRPGRTSNN